VNQQLPTEDRSFRTRSGALRITPPPNAPTNKSARSAATLLWQAPLKRERVGTGFWRAP